MTSRSPTVRSKQKARCEEAVRCFRSCAKEDRSGFRPAIPHIRQNNANKRRADDPGCGGNAPVSDDRCSREIRISRAPGTRFRRSTEAAMRPGQTPTKRPSLPSNSKPAPLAALRSKLRTTDGNLVPNATCPYFDKSAPRNKFRDGQ